MYQSLTKIVTFRLMSIIFSFFVVFLVTGVAGAATITTMTVKEMAGVSTANYPLTFGHVFKKGDVTGHVYLNNYPTQTDVKTTYDDGSIRFAVISALVPMTANSDTVLNINTTGTAASSTPMDKTEILATDIGATIDLTGLSGSGYSGDLQADLRAAITAASSLDYWLEGDVVSEILIDDRLNNSLNATWEVRFYPDTSYIRISHSIENVEANYRGNINYAVEVKQGNTSPTSVYTKADFQHNYQARWRKVFWLGTEPPEVEVHYDLDYLISTGMIPNYDTSLAISETTISDQYAKWVGKDTDIMGEGLQNPYFAGGDEGALLQNYAVLYLMTWDNRLREVVLGEGEVSASCPIHYREWDNAKSFYGHSISVDDRPGVRTREGKTKDLLTPIGTVSSQWTVDQAHQWNYDYLPYLITGEKWFLDELYYWSSFNMTYQNPEYRNYSDGIIPPQIQTRGIAWAYRTMVMTAAIAPDDGIEKDYLEDKIGHNISYLATESTKNTLRYLFTSNDGPNDLDPDTVTACSAWMQDFLLLSLSFGGDLGYDAGSVLTEFSKFIVGRFTDDDFNPFNGAEYRFPMTDSGGVVDTWSGANALYLIQSTEYFSAHGVEVTEDYVYSYRFKAMAAASQITNYAGGQAAYDFLKANVLNQEDLNGYPVWAIIPKGPKPPIQLHVQ